MSIVLGWIGALALIAVGFAGTVLPALPGGGDLPRRAARRLDRPLRGIGWPTLLVLAVLMVLGLIVDALAAHRRASCRRELRAAVIGSLVGGLVGLFFACPGSSSVHSSARWPASTCSAAPPARRCGSASELDRLALGTLARLGIGVMMIVVFCAAVPLCVWRRVRRLACSGSVRGRRRLQAVRKH
ncbi:MAG: hypothetical protein U1F30_10135 [Steroidobacteraceae bacterium]